MPSNGTHSPTEPTSADGSSVGHDDTPVPEMPAEASDRPSAESEGEAGTARAKLLDAAAAEFSEKGVAGARVDAIAARAGVNKQLLYYYFGSKDGLFRELLRIRLARPKGVPGDESPTTGERMASAARQHLDDPAYIRLLTWEALASGPTGEVAEEEARRESYERLVEGIRASQEAGEIPADLDPHQLALSRLAQVLFPVAFPQLSRLVTGMAIDDPAFADARAAHLRRIYDDVDHRRR